MWCPRKAWRNSAHDTWWPSGRVAVWLAHQALADPRSCWAAYSLLELGIVQEPKLGLGDAKLVIRLKRISHLDERQRVHHQEVSVGGVHHRWVVWLVHSTVHEVLY
jgi:hypothetical protein